MHDESRSRDTRVIGDTVSRCRKTYHNLSLSRPKGSWIGIPIGHCIRKIVVCIPAVGKRSWKYDRDGIMIGQQLW